MKIAILGWGSLLWDVENGKDKILKTKGDWNDNGPILPLEFSRISSSRKGALTLVIDPDNGRMCQTSYILSTRKNLEDSIGDLREREGTSDHRIGFVNLIDGSQRSNVMPTAVDIIGEWAHAMNFDAVVWTDLPSNFKEKTEKDFSPKSATIYLEKELNKEENPTGFEAAHEYISKAPEAIKTSFREAIVKHSWFIYNR